MFAVLKTGGKQYKVSSGDVLRVEKLDAQAGEKIQFNEILLVGGPKTVVGSPLVADAGVQAEVIEQIKGVKTINITDKTGQLISLKNVSDEDDLMVINRSGITIRIGVDTLRVMGRATQGVKLIRLRDDDLIASVAKVSKFEAIESEDEGNDDELESNSFNDKNLADKQDKSESDDSNN